MNLHFEFPTLKSVLKPATAATKRSHSPAAQELVSALSKLDTDAANACANSSTAATSGTHTSTCGGVLFVTPILLAAASGKWNVFRELLWRHADCM